MASLRFKGDPELSRFFSRLWDLDKNRLLPGIHFELDLQGATKYNKAGGDFAEEPLFQYLNEKHMFSKDTYRKFIALLDNYSKEIGVPEVVTEQEKRENEEFLDSILETDVMQETHRFLTSKGKVSPFISDFKALLYKIWFKLYNRSYSSRSPDSSAFEHVFVGETRGSGGDVIGFHNWIQFYLQEKKKLVDYKGFIANKCPKDEVPYLYTIQFSWKNNIKAMGSTFIGTSPEFEIALYTICFLLNENNRIPLQIKDYEVEIVCHRNHGHMGSAYPVAK